MITQIKVGTFQLGHRNVLLLAHWETGGGEFFLCPDDDSIPRIRVSLGGENWGSVLNYLLHEALEMSLTVNNLRYERTGRIRGDHGCYLFNFDHQDFCYTTEETAMFLTAAIPALKEVFDKGEPKEPEPPTP